MDELLKPVSTSYTTNKDAWIEISKVETPKAVLKASFRQASTPEEALEILKNEPDHHTLISTLTLLDNPKTNFNIHSPGPLASQLLHVLVSEILPNYWTVLSKPHIGKRPFSETNAHPKYHAEAEVLLSCLRSVPGLNAILLSVKQHIQFIKATKKQVGGQSSQETLSILLQVLEASLEGNATIKTLWESFSNTPEPEARRKALWNDFLSFLGGKALGLAAEAEDVLNEFSKKSIQKYWIAESNLYSSWVAKNISNWAKTISADRESEWKPCGEVLSKSFRLGHTDSIIKEVLDSLLLQKGAHPSQILRLLGYLPIYEQRNLLFSVLKILAKDHLSAEITSEADSQWWKSNKDTVAAAATLIKILLAKELPRRAHLISWLTSSSGAGFGEGIAIRRAAITAIAEDKNDLETVLEKSLQQFGDQLYIKHVPSMQQEVHAQVLLLSAGQFHRRSPHRYAILMRAGAHLQAVSNRLGASSLRARFLGMVIAEALSGLIDQGDKRMDFKVDEMKTPEAMWYKGLVNVSDSVGSLAPLQSSPTTEIPQRTALKTNKPATNPKSKAPQPQGSKIIAIEEVSDEEEQDDSDPDGLTPYAKPDSDPDDSDDDPTLITRNKPAAPVYIRTLIAYLRSSENYDHQKQALLTAAPLIRRKATFGSELSSHTEEVAALLVGIQDKYEIDNFEQLRLQGMIALIIAQPQKMGPWFAKTFFDGDYSLSQRASILTALGLGARELGGFGAESNPLTEEESTFPSKTLPEAAHKRFKTIPTSTTSSLKPIASLSQHLQTTFLRPLASSITDQSLGPDILKLQPLSSRYKSTNPSKPPQKRAITNKLATIISTSFFFPLTGRFHLHLRAYGTSSSKNVLFQPYLLIHFLRTLAILLHSSGPSTLSLPQMTSEFWDLLLSLRTNAIGDVSVLEALLFCLLTLLEVNEEKRGLVEENGGRLVETQGWVEVVFGRLGGVSGEGEEGRVRMLAAAVLVRIGEVVERYQALLMGDLIRLEG